MVDNRYFPPRGTPQSAAYDDHGHVPYDPSGYQFAPYAPSAPDPYLHGQPHKSAYHAQPGDDPYISYSGQGVPPAYLGHASTSMPYRTAQPEQPASTHLSMAGVTHALGAVLSVALIVGAAGWAWNLMQRDVAGVPVVRALEGPTRVMPDDPGGRQAAHQGLAVNELAGSVEEAAREQIVLAPPPLELPEDAVPPPANMQPAAPDAAETRPIPVSLTQEVHVPQGPALGMNSPTRRAVANSPRPPRRNTGAIDQGRMAALSAPTSDTTADDDLAATLANSVAAGLSAVRDIDVDPATLGPGTRLVQLGAYDDAATARSAWDQLARRFAPLLDDRGRVIEAAHSGGSVFYRLRAHGFADERDARRFCAALVAQQIDCIPVLIR